MAILQSTLIILLFDTIFPNEWGTPDTVIMSEGTILTTIQCFGQR